MMQQLQRAIATIDSHPELAAFSGGAHPEEIHVAEVRLRARLPISYRTFLETFGAGSFGSHEIYGLTAGNDSIPSAVWITLRRRTEGLPSHLIVIGSSGYGTFDCLSLRPEEDRASVEEWTPMGPGEWAHVRQVADDFGEYLLERVEAAVEIAASEFDE